MDLPSAKELAKLAAACRKAGITQFKGGGIEFTLSDAPLVTKAAKKAALADVSETKEVPSDELSYEQLLAWSIPGIEDEKEKVDQ